MSKVIKNNDRAMLIWLLKTFVKAAPSNGDLCFAKRSLERHLDCEVFPMRVEDDVPGEPWPTMPSVVYLS